MEMGCDQRKKRTGYRAMDDARASIEKNNVT
jgi:hypothetical protein